MGGKKDRMIVQPEFSDRVVGFEAGPLQILFVEGVAVADDGGMAFQPTGVGFQSGRIHGDQTSHRSPGVLIAWSAKWT